jgi:hypothetical protein
MIHRHRIIPLLLLAVALLLVVTPSRAEAATMLQDQTVTVAANQIVTDDVYAAGGSIVIDGRVNGDVVAFAGTVTINGTVAGNVMVAAGTTTINGKVGGTLRAVGGTVTVNGTVGKDVVVGSGTLTIGGSALIGRDVWSGAGTTTVNGHIARDVQAAGALYIISGAAVGGDVTYSGDVAPEIAAGTAVHGTVQHVAAPPGGPSVAWTAPWSVADPGAAGFGWIRMLIGLFLLGLVMALLAPRFSRRAISQLEGTPWKSVGWGLVFVIVVPFLAVAIFVAGVFVGGWWLALILIALYLMALPVSMVTAGLALGHWVLTRLGQRESGVAWELLLGLVLLGIISLVPVAGAIVLFAASLLGGGALLLSLSEGSRQERTMPA